MSFYQARNVLGFFCYYCVQRGFLRRENSTELFAIILVQLVPAISKKICSSVSLTTSTSCHCNFYDNTIVYCCKENWWWDIVISRAMATVNWLRMIFCVKTNKQTNKINKHKRGWSFVAIVIIFEDEFEWLIQLISTKHRAVCKVFR